MYLVMWAVFPFIKFTRPRSAVALYCIFHNPARFLGVKYAPTLIPVMVRTLDSESLRKLDRYNMPVGVQIIVVSASEVHIT